MSKKKIITIPEIRRAYKITEFKGVCGRFCQFQPGAKRPTACPLVTLYAANHLKILKQYLQFIVNDSELEDNTLQWAHQKYGINYTNGFICGVDTTLNTTEKYVGENELQGFREGRAIRKAMELRDI